LVRFFFGKTKVMAKALGLTPSEEHLPNLAALTAHLAGNVGLLFTNRSPASIIDFFATYTQTDFARAGVVASQTFTIPAGVVHSRGGEIADEEDVPLPHSVETTVRKWGMPTKLVQGKVVLDAEYTVCKEGDVLNSHQTALLKMFGVAMADFRIDVKAYYDKVTAEVTEVGAMEE
jgi:mRNA turnover protein 4